MIYAYQSVGDGPRCGCGAALPTEIMCALAPPPAPAEWEALVDAYRDAVFDNATGKQRPNNLRATRAALTDYIGVLEARIAALEARLAEAVDAMYEVLLAHNIGQSHLDSELDDWQVELRKVLRRLGDAHA